MQRRKWLDYGLGFFAILTFSSTYTLVKIALFQLPPITLGAVRFLLCTALVLPFVLVKYRSKVFLGHTKRDWVDFIIVSLTIIFFPQFLQNVGLLYTTASISGVIQSAVPIFATLLAFMFLKEKISPRYWIGGTISLAGIILLSTGGNLLGGLAGSTSLGNGLQVGATIFYAVGGIYLKKVLKKHPPAILLTMSFLISGILLTIFAFPLESKQWPNSVDSATIIAMLLLSGLYSAGLFCWYWVLGHVSVARLYFSLFLLPILGVLIAVLTLHEAFGILNVLFSAVILLGLGIAELPHSMNKVSETGKPEIK